MESEFVAGWTAACQHYGIAGSRSEALSAAMEAARGHAGAIKAMSSLVAQNAAGGRETSGRQRTNETKLDARVLQLAD